MMLSEGWLAWALGARRAGSSMVSCRERFDSIARSRGGRIMARGRMYQWQRRQIRVDWKDGGCMQKPMQRVEIGREEREACVLRMEKLFPSFFFDQDITPAENLRN